ncbi:MAG: 50S ribosomal protein L30e [Thermoplasmata archaeon]|nr:MAG: 50S ribosomal protein L30e [Thermoplasmata archaeon]
MDINRALRMAIDKGKVHLGARETARALKRGKVQLVIVANNCRQNYMAEFNKYPKVPIYHFSGTNIELGSACGKPFPISSLAVIDSGNSNIMNLIQEPGERP